MTSCRIPLQRSRGRPEPGDVWWVEGLEFINADGRKDRPVVVIGNSGGSVVCCRCTSKRSQYRERHRIMDDVSAGLDRTTYVDRERVAIPRGRLAFRMGRLCDEDWEEVKGNGNGFEG
ncbi:MAG: type II toxin-antitoxin system PemK/MazF family toxin [Candidatus Methanomethylophilaceae archaeon]|nr:type II toxin-antitoxin system PemK/MazF family toxin [Candidatus Methanomethylophilaceae archaeon]